MFNGDTLAQVLDRIRTSLWFVPGLMTVAAALLAWAVPRMDRFINIDAIRGLPLIFTGQADGARAVLATVAGSTITIAGVVFSMTLVSLQLASSQFGPRLLRTFLRDRANQVVLGTFVATFLYSILLLPVIDEAEEHADRFVPHLAVSLSVAMSLVSLGMLVYFIDHVAQAIQADSVIAAVTLELDHTIDRHFPESPMQAPESSRAAIAAVDRPAEGRRIQIAAEREGYLRFVNFDELIKLAEEWQLVIELEVNPGPYILIDDRLATVWGPEELSRHAQEQIERAFVIGPHRTALQDVAFVFEQLVEMGVRALSPGINDPTTAIHCIDNIGSGLARIVKRDVPSDVRCDHAGRVCIRTHPVPFAELLQRSVRPMRRNAGQNVGVWLRLIEMLASVYVRAVREEDRALLREEARGVHDQAMAQVPAEDDRAMLSAALQALSAEQGSSVN